MKEHIPLQGTVHALPQDLTKVITSDERILTLWNSLTSLSRNEWICWVIRVKKDETRKKHMRQLCENLLEGKRRPCCWAGCPHRGKSKQVKP